MKRIGVILGGWGFTISGIIGAMILMTHPVFADTTWVSGIKDGEDYN